ncbi:uncharacterized protein LOC108865167 [Galendromus occidentalis]|uniref:Uncharacterized protein LOC108865167 n=1 Tax=Galendromus occidentalis TaxID=34638 RepID=A0AAJ7PAZ0_9ACAR|nr:uncharacterized protein LOC108865167 [Galendromus occidentalis]
MPVDQPEDLSKILKTLTGILSKLSTKEEKSTSTTEPSSERGSTALTNATVLLGTFNYAPDADNTFPEWYSRNQGILEECVESPSLRAKVLLKALGTEEYTRLRCHVSPAKPESKTFDELLGILNQLFGPTKSLFRRRFDILNIRSPAGTHPEEILNLCNLKGDEFEVNNLTADQFKIFLDVADGYGSLVQSFSCVVLRTLDEKPGIDLLELREKVKQHVRRQEDATIGLNSVDENPVSINQVTSQRAARPPPRGSRQQPDSKCKGCEGSHFRSQCPFLKSKCNGCGKKGHLKKTQFPKLFETSLGLCSKIEVDLRLKDNVAPTCLPARPLALPIRELVDKELERLLDNGTLYKVESSDWATPIVVVRKANGQIRMCADYSTGLNEALRDVDYPLPNMEEIMSRFSGNRIFTQLDLADAYLQLPLTAESRKLTTINTHRGLYQYNRLVFGLKTATGTP